jgi:lysophospholipase L1-like esterase
LESKAMTDIRTATTSGRRRGWSQLAGNLVLAGASVLAGLVVCELLLRLLGVSYPVYVWVHPVRGVGHIPGVKSAKQFEGHSWIEINSDGWRGPEPALKPPPGTFRIALLGDSYIEAFEVPYEKTVGELMEARLSALRGTPVEVLNFGNGGYGTTQHLLTLQHEVWKYSPDLVLLAVTTGNDISDNYRPLKRTDYVPYHVFRGEDLVLDSSFLRSKGYRRRALWTRELRAVVQYSRLAQLVNRVRHTGNTSERLRVNARGAPGDEVGLRDEVQLPPTTPGWQEAWRVTEGLLGLMRDECRRKDTPFAIVTLTRGIQVTPVRQRKEEFLRQLGAKDLYYPERRLAEFGKREGIPVLNLAPDMARQAEERQVYFHVHHDSLGIGHWSEAGHQAAGELIARWLAEEFPDRSASPSLGQRSSRR